ncbi:hypothetical protein [Streptomyces sp. NBC_00443]|uniref:hypothetical protein n=1 Tax=Streptomyces sp. NBC_00443 TaxID=2975743 RepID=UPI002E1E29DB
MTASQPASARETAAASARSPRDAWTPLIHQCGFTSPWQTGPTDHSVLLAATPGATADAPACPEPLTDAAWLVATESDAETPTARELAALLGPGTGLTAPTDSDAWKAALPTETSPRIVLLLAEPDAQRLVAQTSRRAAVLRTLAAACGGLPEGRAPQVWLVARPTGLFPAPEHPAHPEDAAIWGATRTLANEQPGLGLRRISLDRTGDPAADARRLAAELLTTCRTPDGVRTRSRTRSSSRRPAASLPFTSNIRPTSLLPSPPVCRAFWRHAIPAPPSDLAGDARP